jgi:hypothetical protein
MTPGEFRRLALRFPEAIEGADQWGANGSTVITLRAVETRSTAAAKAALEAAWRKRAPKRLLATLERCSGDAT